MFAEGLRLTRWGSDVWGCNVVDPASADERERGKLRVGHLFFLSKLVELCDTLIFVLRRKGSQVTVLHVVHHSLVPLLIWLGFKVSPGGNMALFPLLNSAIHTAMYTYYALSTLGPRVRRRYLWWKRHLTTVQMAQFVVVMVHSLHVLVLPGCHFPRLLLYIQLVNGLLFLVLFYSFYRATYGRPPPSTLTKEPAQETSLVDNNNCLKCH
ncbi:Elongation of very long chain fatty acids protein 1 [Halotydeus destructor]|nr:Elongation of very long chain fatty acids protein 1 [Halotydeus destructor]